VQIRGNCSHRYRRDDISHRQQRPTYFGRKPLYRRLPVLIIADSFPRNLGYVEIDNRQVDAPLPPGNVHFEADAYTCSHCERVVIKTPERTRERYKCHGCKHHICDDCEALRFAGKPCKTYAQFIDELREQDARQPEPGLIILP
jgi:hypothetical protein